MGVVRLIEEEKREKDKRVAKTVAQTVFKTGEERNSLI